VKNLLMDRYGYDSGAITGFKHEAPNTKGLLKLDYNISNNHSLSYTYNFLDAFKDKSGHPSAVGRRGPDFITLQMQNSGYTINNKISSHLVELKSVFGSSMSNKLQVGLTNFNDARTPFSTPFPVININKDGQRYIVAGHEPFSVHNRLKQDVFQINNNLNIYSGNHTFTVGAAFEKFSFDNSFNLTTYQGVFGHIPIPGTFFSRDFSSVDEFVGWVNDGNFDAAVENAQNTFDQFGGANGGEGIDTDTTAGYQGWALAETNLGQISVYAQDEYQVSDQLTITAGVRLDKPTYLDTKDKIEENLERNGAYIPTIEYYEEDGTPIMLEQTDLPDAKLLINPRFGFNYDISGDRTRQLRGGTGLFSGRFPFVWFGNQVANPNFFFYTTTAKDFKFPQVWRTNLGYDHKMDNGWTGTVDLLYTKDINASMVRNYGLKPPTGKLEGVDERPIYTAADRNSFGNDAYVFSATDVGYSFNASFQLQKAWGNNFAMIGYNYLNAEDASSIDAEISSDAYARNPGNITHVNTPLSAPSSYGNTHRVIAALSKKFSYANDKLATTVSLFAESASGSRYSYTYGGDINGDGSGLNDLIYIPTEDELEMMNFTSLDQKNAFGEYIAQDSYLNSRRGDFAEKYGAETPWFTQIDMRVLQDLSLGNQKIQLSLDVKNIANLINSDWGVLQYASQTGLAQVVGVSVEESVPTYSFDAAQKQTFFDDFSLASRWQAQVGLRFIF
ncbi:MAG: TonB-dependent receptor, partial [Saprospiraceae bacterium]